MPLKPLKNIAYYPPPQPLDIAAVFIASSWPFALASAACSSALPSIIIAAGQKITQAAISLFLSVFCVELTAFSRLGTVAFTLSAAKAKP